MLTFLHAADFHLDSPFAALNARQAAERRRENLELLSRMADYVNDNNIPLVLLTGELFDGAPHSRVSVDALRDALGQMNAWVFAAPDGWTDDETIEWPENVTVFRKNEIEAVPVPELDAVIHGFPEPETEGFAGFAAPEDGLIHIGLLHGILPPEAELAESGLAYLAFGHKPEHGELRCGKTLCAWPGCPEGRNFDETGERGFLRGIVDADGAASVEFVPFCRRRYEVLTVDLTDREPLEAVEAALSDTETAPHLYRMILTGETEEPDFAALRETLAERFWALDLRDNARLRNWLWNDAGPDTLRGLFLHELRQQLDTAQTGEERLRVHRAARYGLAALDRRSFA